MSRANRKDRQARRFVSEKPCLICGRSPSDPHHYPLRRSHGGQDVLMNMVPLCREHHRAYHDGDHQIIELVAQSADSYFDALPPE